MKRVVIKVGSHILSEYGQISKPRIEKLCELIVSAMQRYEVILVSSGAIAVGTSRINIKKDSVVNKQVLASVGQPYLMEIYEKIFSKYNITIAQILLTAADFDSRKSTQKSRDLVNKLCDYKILPIINENDATAIEEIVFGDNDSLSAGVTYYFDADILVILSDIDGYYDCDPQKNSGARRYRFVNFIKEDDLNLEKVAGSNVGTGGIVTKLKAAKFLIDKNKPMFLASGFELGVATDFLIKNIQSGGTIFCANLEKFVNDFAIRLEENK